MYKVLVIDDEKPVRQAILAMGRWEAAGITQFYEALEGESGLALLREHRPQIVMVDMKMPRMDGSRFLEIACQEYPESKYIVISGYDDYEYTRQAIRVKVLDYLLKPVSAAELNGAITLAVQELQRQPQQATRPIGKEEFRAEKNPLYAIKNFIDQNYFHEIKLCQFAQQYYLNKEYLSKLFKDEFGYSIYEYVLKIRMEKAKELLAEPTARIGDISEHLGYHDHNYFSKAFKTYFGLTPSEYREKLTASGL